MRGGREGIGEKGREAGERRKRGKTVEGRGKRWGKRGERRGEGERQIH